MLTCDMETAGRRKTQVSSGFTLIEPLVVIAIVSILVAIPFPAFALGRHTGGASFLLVEGHMDWMRAEAVSSGRTAALPADLQGATVGGFSASGAESAASGLPATFNPC